MKPFEVYLFLYNGIQVLGWGSILLKAINWIGTNGTNQDLYDNTYFLLQLFQTAAILEIIHCAIGFVRSPVGTTIMQVYSRVFVTWGILYSVKSSQSSIGVPMLVFAWSITEVVRYSFYALSLIKSVPYALIWMRYTFFIVLYPLGASGELFTMIAGLNEIDSKKILTLEMPNKLNFAFSYWWYIVIMCLLYIPGFPKMYFYMFGQRKKVLKIDSSKKSK
uniref:Very-long-chain (3R)-3-hydroxyacyl-CoA dehydratase n=1 Tax=Parastrongyloides trichosuri TaxID=131310 RepID=A0A0N4ZTM1_PARTI